MFQNMKVDIIYYKTNTDFEMEFNLCGCCRMRLLTDKSPDRKTMVHSLARAVSRSKIIIVVGSLFGESGSIKSVCEAIGTKLSVVNNSTYGIKSNEEISIISGSTPLVTPDGIFGGCIIESGPQTMILLSDNKPVRKSIMHTLIHPYVAELYANEITEKHSTITEDTFQEDELILESYDEAEELTEDEIVTDFVTEEDEELDTPIEIIEELEKQNNDFLTDGENAQEMEPLLEHAELLTDIDEIEEFTDDDGLVSAGIVFETEETEHDQNPDIEPDLPKVFSGEDDYEFEDISEFAMAYRDDKQFVADDFTDSEKARRFSLNKPIFILAILLLITVAVLFYCIFIIPAKSDTTAVAYIKETFDILFG